ncbi:MAG TPA: RtcB family protein [Thermoanaerobaculaceae bacterium]|nr:RtcB family protein [Thermoanaerobaculaceae bacterium]
MPNTGRTLERLGPGTWQVPPTGGMRVPARVYASEKLLAAIRGDHSLQQACNVAHLPGIAVASLAMPDMHEGYGFPIGGVAAFDADEGVISPGGVGYDINCGVRLMRTDLALDDLGDRLPRVVEQVRRAVPAGVGSEGAIPPLSERDLDEVLREGAAWAVRQGFGEAADLEFTEARGCLAGADPRALSRRARERGAPQLGTLGSGNHFAELGVVDEVLEPACAEAFGLGRGNVTVLLHSGSRGLGYQVCDDALDTMQATARRHRIPLPDPQLVAVPASSAEGGRYLAAMRAAANFAWANRQVMMALIERAIERALGGDRGSLGFRLVYDVAHNVAKVEEHDVEGSRRRLLVHRKGATRAFPSGHPELPAAYRDAGQPVLIPGDMGRASYVCVGTPKAMAETFGSAAHGAGRVLSRHAARRAGGGRDIAAELARRGVVVAARSPKTLAEEMPEAYKDAGEVVAALEQSGIARAVARLRPIGVVKG